MAHCKVWLENYHQGQYYPGSQINGKVILNFSSETKFRKIKVQIFGHEHTEWTGTEEYTENNETKTRDVQLYSDNNVFSSELLLQGGNSETAILPAGQHVYPFSFTLPTSIPGTYNCEFGSVTYKVVGTVDRPMAFDYQDQFIFVVAALVDLNNLRKPELLEPTSYSDDKTVCCCCCAQGPITMDVTLPKRTLVLEETINIPVRISNMSNTNIERIELKLLQKITCKLSTSVDSKTIRNELINLEEVGVGAHGQHTFTFPVKLPSNCTIPNFMQCKLIQVNYVYEVTAKLPGIHSNLMITMYPKVGNIEIGQQAPISGFIEASNAYNFSPLYPMPGQNISQGNYPYAGNQQYPIPAGVYPPPTYSTGQFLPAAGTMTGYPEKEAEGFPSAPPSNELPPSYDSLVPPK